MFAACSFQLDVIVGFGEDKRRSMYMDDRDAPRVRGRPTPRGCLASQTLPHEHINERDVIVGSNKSKVWDGSYGDTKALTPRDVTTLTECGWIRC